ncbi:apolipoprotein N-acyltransferase [Brachybacterium huguangmaarense]|uniref:Apolipoprotein N-acyltransferase n=1 Tax=Brachybacterium huguangmaarense TaxID=1652028 RepID=A0ABY6G0Z9_9MICO|nr:apolipoprotein N-acyltransferase [Brachybacterium huguangmaarense]UYG16321.1 apolipoprotein N-acyltransferase [Brachybacterium huguangmaarense]
MTTTAHRRRRRGRDADADVQGAADGARGNRGTIRATPWPVALVLAVAGGLAAWLAFPPYDLWFLLPIALAALDAAILVRRAALAGLLGLIWGFAFFLPLSQWANIYAGLAPWAALAVVEGLFFALYALLARAVLIRRGVGLSGSLVVACLWAGVEALRSHVPWGGLPWGASAFALQHSPLLNLGPWIGTAGLAAVVALVAQLLLAGALALLGRRPGRRALRGLWPVGTAAFVVLACLVVPSPPNPRVEGDSTMRIAGIQGNTPRIAAQDLTMPDEIFPHSLELTSQAAADARADAEPLDLVVWPEGSAGWDLEHDPAGAAAVTAAAADVQAPLLVGTQTPGPDETRYNMSLLWTAEGTVAQSYAKRHPVPFGEYIPARGLIRHLSDKVDLVSRDMLPGDRVGVMDVDGRRVGVLICFEIAYENLVQDTVDAGADVIVVQTNTALFGDSDEAAQQLAEARVFAVVSGRSVVQVATVGESAIITPDGRDLARTGHWVPGTVTADVPLYAGITPAMAAGPWIAIALGALGAAGLLLSLPRRARVLAARPVPSRRTR